MPNHVTTILRATPDILDTLRSASSEVDFNTVIPYPEELAALTSEYKVFPTQEEVDAHQQKVDAQNASLPAYFRLQYEGKVHAITQERQRELVEKYGTTRLDWYGWSVDHWGTKWNAYSIDTAPEIQSLLDGVDLGSITFPFDGTGLVKFETAWSYPEPVILALSAKFPHDLFHTLYADENTGYNYGYGVYRGGERIEGRHEPLGRGTDAACEFATRVRYNQTYAEFEAEWA